jgi:hypothetical protein
LLVGGQTGNLIAGVGSVFVLVVYGGELVVRHRETRNAL